MGKSDTAYGLLPAAEPWFQWRMLPAVEPGRGGRPEPTPEARKALLSQSRVESEKSFSSFVTGYSMMSAILRCCWYALLLNLARPRRLARLGRGWRWARERRRGRQRRRGRRG